ncbi:MAG: hypothetical protein R3F34_03415 [Planctomycetota bacterium]
MKRSNFLVALAIAALHAGVANADTLVGRLLDSNGQPVANVDLDFKNQGSGGNPTVSGDHSGPDGRFTVTIPLGLYDVMFFPPQPPASTCLYHEIPNVSIAGVKDLGDIVLPAGYAVTGRALGPGGVPIVGMDLDVIDSTTGDVVEMTYDLTDALGRFAVAVPTGPCEVIFDGSSIIGQTYVWKGFEFDLAGDLDLGDLVFETGATLNGRVTTTGGVGIFNADVDVYDSNGDLVYTAHDSTNATGNFSVVSPIGVVDLEICTPFSSPGASFALPGVAVAGPTTNIGTKVAPNAATLSGVVRDFNLVPVSSGDVDLRDAVTGADVFLCNDHVNANGTYAVRVPQGTYEVIFEPVDFSVPLGSDHVQNVVITTSTVLDGVLPSCPFPTTYGTGTPGAGGIVPQMGSVGGAPRHQNGGFGFTVDDTVGGTVAYFVVGFGSASFPFGSGTGLIDPFGPILYFPFFTTGAPGVPGAGSATFPVPVTSNLVGIHPFVQTIVVDVSTVDFFALSNAVTTTFCQ